MNDHHPASSSDEDEPLLQRVRETPRPATIWIVGALVLLALDLGTAASGLLDGLETLAATLGNAVVWTAEALDAGGWTAWVILVTGVVTLALVGLALATWTRLAVIARLTERFSPKRTRLLDGLVLTVAIALIAAIGFRLGAADLLRAVADWARIGLTWLGDLPSITSRETIPNRGYQTPDGTWHGTFLGLSPAIAWGIRVLVVHVYVAVWLVWVWTGYRWFREHYRRAEWSPRDDVVRRLRYHRWGQFGLFVVLLFLTMALYASTLGPTTAAQNLYSPFSHSIEYYDEATNTVQTVLVGEANLQTRSVGYPAENVGPMSYDRFDRFHPFGTLTNGKDLFTFLAHGARVSLIIGLLSVGLSGVFATVFALISAYYRGIADLVLVVTGDTIMGVPRLLLLILLTVIMADTWLGRLYDGGILLAVILAATGWPYLWRAFRGPTLQVSEEEWVDAARSYGQSVTGIMRLHMLPYLVGYILIYSSLVLGGVILAVAGLSFLGLGITAPTPEWGRAVDMGREYVATPSWHISLIPGVMITLVVMGFNAVGDALRDAVDPKSDDGVSAESETQTRGGGV